MEKQDFGSFLSSARRHAGLSLRTAAKRLGITAAYLSDVENGRRRAFDISRLRTFVGIAGLNEEEASLLFDLAGKSRGEVSPDISEYLTDNLYICTALRTARTLRATQDDWQRMLEQLKQTRNDSGQTI